MPRICIGRTEVAVDHGFSRGRIASANGERASWELHEQIARRNANKTDSETIYIWSR